MLVQDYPILKYGPFIETVVDFLLISTAIFLIVKAINAAKNRLDMAKTPDATPEPSEEILLLRQIRDSLGEKK
jgi:large conductance mechanosensitive channel